MNEEIDVLKQIVDELPSLTKAIECCVRRSGLTDKQIYLELGIDAAQWSRIKHGHMHFPLDKFCDFMQICGSHIPLMWIAKKMGYDLVQSTATLEEKLKAIQEELKQKEAVITEQRRTIDQFFGK